MAFVQMANAGVDRDHDDEDASQKETMLAGGGGPRYDHGNAHGALHQVAAQEVGSEGGARQGEKLVLDGVGQSRHRHEHDAEPERVVLGNLGQPVGHFRQTLLDK